jgi:hypothetical protein
VPPEASDVDEVEPRCANCGGPNLRAFCADCGQKRPHASDYSLAAVLSGAWTRIAQFDGRLFATVRELLLRPGQVTRDHFDGKRDRYIAPFQMFVLANLAAWIAIPKLHIRGFSLEAAETLSLFHDFWNRMMVERAAFSGLTSEAFARSVEAEVASTNRLAVVCLIPFFALGTAVVLSRRAYRPVQHLVFAAHFYCVHLTSLVVVWGLMLGPTLRLLLRHPEWAMSRPLFGVLSMPWVQHLSVAPFLLPYLFLAIRRAYRTDVWSAAWRATLLALWAVTLSRAFLDVGYAIMLVVA